MDIAFASNGATGAGGFAGFIPLLLMGCIFGLVLGSIAKRKGKSIGLWFFAGIVPLWNLFGGLWLVSLPDKSILDEIESLKSDLKKIKSANSGSHESL